MRDPDIYPFHVGTSFVQYRGSGFWTRDAALETVLGLLVAELQPLCNEEDRLSAVLDHWTLQATAGFTGCVSADLDKNLADPNLRSRAIAALRHVLAALPADGLVHAADPGFLERAERVTAGESWHCPAALASWVIEVSQALIDLVEGNLRATSRIAVAGRGDVKRFICIVVPHPGAGGPRSTASSRSPGRGSRSPRSLVPALGTPP